MIAAPVSAAPAADQAKPKKERIRTLYNKNIEPGKYVNILGPFLWACADNNGEDALFGDGVHHLAPTDDRSHLVFSGGPWMSRVNLTSMRSGVAYTVQLKWMRLFTPGSHNAKIMMGYMPTSWRFTHADGKDLVHWADAPRVVLYLPMRHGHRNGPDDQSAYFFSPYEGQSPSVLEFRPGEHVQYPWFNPEKFNERILFDLYPHCKAIKPCVEHPIFKFELFPQGKWRVSLETDGRDGLKGGAVDGDFDHVFTEASDGAKPYSVELADENAFSLTSYNPSAKTETYRACVKVDPFDRATGRPLPHSDRKTRVWDIPVEQVEARIAAAAKLPAAAARAVEATEDDGRILLRNRFTEVEITPRKGMFVPIARDLATGREIFTVLKLNFPYFEHGIKESQPAGYRILENTDGSVTVAMNMRFGHHRGPKEIERYGRFGERSLSQYVTLRPESAAVEFRGRVDNPTPLRRSNRLWDRALLPVPQDRNLRFIMPVSHGVEHDANWIKAWPEWKYAGELTDFSDARSWGQGRPTQYFGLYPVHGFAGAWYPNETVNRLRIGNPRIDPGMKVYFSRGNLFELWGGTTSIFEDPGHFLPGFVPIDYTKYFYLTTGIGQVQYADRHVAVHVRTGGSPLVQVTGPEPLSAVTVEMLDKQTAAASTTGAIGPGQVLTLRADRPLPEFRLRISAPRQPLLDMLFPLEIPNQGFLYDRARKACSRERRDYIELQEHSNHRGIPAAMAATGAARGVLEAESRDLRELVSLAYACYRIGDFGNATSLADKVLELHAIDPDAHHVKGLIAYEQGRPEAAEHLARAGIQAHYVRALLAVAAGRDQDALALLGSMLHAVPRAFRPRLLHAWLLARSGKAVDALPRARVLFDGNAASPEAAEVLSRVALVCGKKELADEAAAARDALVTGNPDAERQLGLFRAELDRGKWAYVARYRTEPPQP